MHIKLTEYVSVFTATTTFVISFLDYPNNFKKKNQVRNLISVFKILLFYVVVIVVNAYRLSSPNTSVHSKHGYIMLSIEETSSSFLTCWMFWHIETVLFAVCYLCFVRKSGFFFALKCAERPCFHYLPNVLIQ